MKKRGIYSITRMLLLFLLLATGFSLSRAERPPSMVISVYLMIDASNWEAGSVSVTKTITLNETWLEGWNDWNTEDQLPQVIFVRQEVPLTKNALDYEFTMPLFEMNESGDASINVLSPQSNRVVTITGMVCDGDCESSHVQVMALPVDTFTQANGGTASRIRYRSTETVEWDLANLYQPVSFTFVPALPFAPFIQPLVENPALLIGGVFGAIVTLIVTVIISLTKDALVTKLRNMLQKPTT